MSRLRILALEPYYGGSHRAVLDGLVQRIDAEWTLLTLPARKWKWRMRGAAITMAQQARALAAEPSRAAADRPFDLVFASTFLNLAEFRGLAGALDRAVPAIVYFHENQLVYPNRHTAEWDFQFPLTNITSALSAEACVFNTRWNLDRFCRRDPRLHPRVSRPPSPRCRRGDRREVPGHRAAVRPGSVRRRAALEGRALPHRLAAPVGARQESRGVLLGGHGAGRGGARLRGRGGGSELPRDRGPDARCRRALGNRLVHCDEPASRAEYAALLASADVAVSTAINEFFGLAMVEACYAGAAPLVPDRLAYPELYGREYRYAGADELVARLRGHIQHRPDPLAARGLAERFTFERLVPSTRRVSARSPKRVSRPRREASPPAIAAAIPSSSMWSRSTAADGEEDLHHLGVACSPSSLGVEVRRAQLAGEGLLDVVAPRPATHRRAPSRSAGFATPASLQKTEQCSASTFARRLNALASFGFSSWPPSAR